MGSFAAHSSLFAQAHVLGWLLCAFVALLLVAVTYSVRSARSRQRLASSLLVANTRLQDMRSHDPLTGLLSRQEFEALLEAESASVDRGNGRLALLYLGLDNFRAVNEAYGLRVGDGLLIEAANRLSTLLANRPHIARVAGDEFVLLLRGDLEHAIDTALRVQQRLAAPCCVESLPMQLSASIGITVYPDDGARLRLMANATLAMRNVKLGGGASHACYHPSMAVDLRDQADLVADLRHAVARQELQLFYQPKIDANSLQITAAEALLRWQHPKRGMIGPTVFVPLAERHGLIASIGLWVIEEACRQAAQWREAGLRMRIAVNISGHQLRRDDLVDQIEASLCRHRIPPGRLTCEITETVAIEDTTVTRQAFERLRRAGLHVSIDDFGTGHSSLAALRRLPAAELKIDRGFVTDLATSEGARSIVRAIVQMARSLNMRVVAEGVETAAQRDELVRLGCDELQGYFFAKPMTATMLALWAGGDEAQAKSMFRDSLFDATAPMPLDP